MSTSGLRNLVFIETITLLQHNFFLSFSLFEYFKRQFKSISPSLVIGNNFIFYHDFVLHIYIREGDLDMSQPCKKLGCLSVREHSSHK